MAKRAAKKAKKAKASGRAVKQAAPKPLLRKQAVKKPRAMSVPRTTPRTIPKNANVKVGAPGVSKASGAVGFAGYPAAKIFSKPDGKEAINQLLWGDWLIRRRGAQKNGYVQVSARGTRGWMKKDEIQDKRLLEIVFVDIGQGDGALVVTPDDQHILIDAGQEDNMFRFLRWKYGKFAKKWSFKAAVISHPDQDHYKGFKRIFEESNVKIETVYHNGLVERTGEKLLGAEKKIGKINYVTDVITDRKQLATLLSSDKVRGKKVYPNMLKAALDSGRVGDIRSLSVADKHLPSFGPDDEAMVRIDILGPITEGDRKAPMLRRFDSGSKYGVTKNGHSIVLRITYGKRTVLLGGDLNIPSEHYLLEQHTGKPVPPKTHKEGEDIIAAARKVFECDVAKACHHGSADFTSLYLRSVNPIATVISSGDDESHSHPRADSLGTIGKFARGERPLVFSTELARSAKELIKNPNLLRADLDAADRGLAAAKSDAKKLKKAKTAHDKAVKAITSKLDRSIAVYGAINLRTDGKDVVIAQRIERSKKDKKWDIYKLEEKKEGFQFISKHEEPVLE
jgi:beta-lactamase superfamily II metal-dependent hydrolase